MRALYTQKQIINLGIHKSLSHQSLRSLQFLRQNHYKTHRRGESSPHREESKRSSDSGDGNQKRRVWNAYNPARGPGNGQRRESESASGGDGQRSYGPYGDRTYRSVRKGQPGGGSVKRGSFDRRVEGFAAGERASGGVEEGSSVRGLDQRLKGFWSCPICGCRVEQKWGCCSGCTRTGKMNWVSGNDGGETQKKKTSGYGVSGNETRGSVEEGNVLERSRSKYLKNWDLGVDKKWSSNEKKFVNCVSQLQVSESAECGSSLQNQASEVDALSQSIMEEGELDSGGETQGGMLSSGDLVSDLRSDRTCESVKTSEGTVGNESSGLEVHENAVQSSLPEQVDGVNPLPLTMKEGLESASGGKEFQKSLSSSGDTMSNLDRDEPCGSVKDSNLVGVSASEFNYDKGVKDLPEEWDAVVVDNGGLVHGLSSGDVAGNWTSGLEVSEGAEPSPLAKQVGGNFSGERVVRTVENESPTHGQGKESIGENLLGNEASELKVSENAVRSWLSKQEDKVHPLQLPLDHETEMASEKKNKIDLSSSSNEICDLDRDSTERSARKAKLAGRLAYRSDFDKGAKDSSKERAFKVVEKGFGQGFSIGDIVITKKKKAKSAWVCTNCGHTEGQWWGACKLCNCVGTIKRFPLGDNGGSGDETSGCGGSGNSVRSWLKQTDEVLPVRLIDVNRGINKLEWRIPLPGSFGSEVARVLGGGLVPGSLVLVGGDPGVGKSTLLLQIAAIIAQGHDIREPGPVVYVSGEESVEQIGNRADRMEIGTKELFLYSSTDIEDILGKTHLLSPRLLIVDSIQTVYLQNVTGSAGGISQVKECTSALLRYAKRTNVPVLLIGHVTKTGDIAGPRVLEHIVDVVLYLEGEKYTSHRLLRSVKNRFGSTDELGVFEMSQSGLRPVLNPSEMYLTEQHSDSEVLAGLAVAAIMDGTRTFLIEIQALCSSGSSRTSRHFNGIQASRADMIISVLTKQAGLKLQEDDIFLNVVSGMKLSETAGDLAIAAAICSSFLEFPIPSGVAFIGEIGLSGELRGVPRMDLRLNTVAQLGYKKCIVPKSALKSLKGLDHKKMEIIGCSNLKQVINTVFRNT